MGISLEQILSYSGLGINPVIGYQVKSEVLDHKVTAPTVQQELNRANNTFNRLDWYLANGYRDNLTFPESINRDRLYTGNVTIQELRSAVIEDFSVTHFYEALRQLSTHSTDVMFCANVIYNHLAQSYGLEVSNDEYFELITLWPKLRNHTLLTTIGVGGSFYVEHLLTVLKVTKDGTPYGIRECFSQTLVHELVEHMFNSMMIRFDTLSHNTKEFIIDYICKWLLSSKVGFMETYQFQSRGDRSIEPYLNPDDPLLNLVPGLQLYTKEIPRKVYPYRQNDLNPQIYISPTLTTIKFGSTNLVSEYSMCHWRYKSFVREFLEKYKINLDILPKDVLCDIDYLVNYYLFLFEENLTEGYLKESLQKTEAKVKSTRESLKPIEINASGWSRLNLAGLARILKNLIIAEEFPNTPWV